jgi:hypothetical protein
MDVRVFGSYYGQTYQLPYASGFGVSLSGTMDTVRFPACRAIFLEADSNQNKGYLAVELTDAPGQVASAIELAGNQLFPISCTAVVSGNLPGLFIFY